MFIFSVWDSGSAVQLLSVVVDFLSPPADSQRQSLGVDGFSFSVWDSGSAGMQLSVVVVFLSPPR